MLTKIESAIIVGGNGLIGRAVVANLSKQRIPVLVVGTAASIHPDLTEFVGKSASYLQASACQNGFDELEAILKRDHRQIKDPVFFNLAWRGAGGITDGSLREQLPNIQLSCDFVRLAKRIGATKYIASGSIEEIFFEKLVNSNNWLSSTSANKRNCYPLIKTAARMQSELEAYRQGLDFCYTRISVAIDKRLRTRKYVEQSLKAILSVPNVPNPENHQLCNIASTDEIARQMVAVGHRGKNKGIYTLGTAVCDTLLGYFEKFYSMRHKLDLPSRHPPPDPRKFLDPSVFELTVLLEHTGYLPSENTENLFNEIIEIA